MLINCLKVQGLLSFGREGIDLPLEPLNVLIGPNGSGKSNLLEALALLQAAPREFSEPINRGGGVREWLWKGAEGDGSAYLEVEVAVSGSAALRHAITLADQAGQPVLIDERVEPTRAESGGLGALFYCRPPRNHHVSTKLKTVAPPSALQEGGRVAGAGLPRKLPSSTPAEFSSPATFTRSGLCCRSQPRCIRRCGS